MGLIGTYTLHLYCDHAAASDAACTDWPGIYTGHTKNFAKGTAKMDGWKFKRDRPPTDEALGSRFEGAVFCANHAGDIPKIKKVEN